MTTRRTLLKSLAGLLGIGTASPLLAIDKRIAELSAGLEADKAFIAEAEKELGDGFPLIGVNCDQSRVMGYDRLTEFDVIGPDGKTVESVVVVVDEREGWIYDGENDHCGDYRIVGLTKAQREEHVRRYG